MNLTLELRGRYRTNVDNTWALSVTSQRQLNPGLAGERAGEPDVFLIVRVLCRGQHAFSLVGSEVVPDQEG